MSRPLEKATDISKVFKALNTDPLGLEDLRDFYKETSDARGEEKPRQEMARSLRNNIGINQHLLLVGYKGCGKSTELIRLEQELQDDFLVLRFSIFQELDPMKLNYIELIIVTMERLFAYAKEHHLSISEHYLKGISDFLNMKEITDIREKYLDVETETGAEGSFTLPFLASFFAKFKASAKSSRSLKTVLTETVEPHFSILLQNCNDLIGQVKSHLYTIQKKDLLIIIEDLDKIKLSEAQDLFLNYANQITSVNANVIYTLPIAISYHIESNTVRNNFSQIYELPMIKVREKNGDKVEAGINAISDIIEARMDIEIFENPSILEELILISGGSLRDLFRLIVNASESSQNTNRKTITDEDKLNSINRLKKEYRNTIADYTDDTGKVIITSGQYYQVLEELNSSKSKHPENTLATMHLKQNTTILGYNGEGWCDVHPIVKEILKEKD